MKKYFTQTKASLELIDAVIAQIGGRIRFLKHYRDVTVSGAQAGFRGFIYPEEFAQFVKANLRHIREAIYNVANDSGVDAYTMVKDFKFRKNYDVTIDEIHHALTYGEGQRAIMDSLALFALQHVADDYASYKDDLND